MTKPAKLPIGIQTFENIRREGYLYVDKTKYLVSLIDSGKVYFISRPRRFGKSLTVTTLEALFSGRRDLFEGLYAEKYLSRPGFTVKPVVRLDMSGVDTDMGPEVMRRSIVRQLKGNAERLGVEIDADSPGDALETLIRRAAEKHGALTAVLVDEYDKPILDHIHDPAKAEEARGILRNFYVRVKAADAYLSFVFITGISKFTKVGVFSAMNNLVDISLNDSYAAMLGYTEEELLSCFDAHIAETAAKLGLSKNELVAKIRGYYDGFSFDGNRRLYNPFSTLSFFNDPSFRNYWFETGTPSYLARYVKRHDLEVESFRGLETDDEFTSTAEIEFASPESFLYQSGYLSVREKSDRRLTLDYPNLEVLSSVAKLFMYGKWGVPNSGKVSIDMEEAMSRGDGEAMIKIYNVLLASLPYDVYERAEAKYDRVRPEEEYEPLRYAESFYHSVLYALIWASRVKTVAERHGYWGRGDIEAEKNGHFYVIELKAADGKEASEKAADAAMEQIMEKGYADKYALSGATLIGIAVDRERRRVGGCRIVRV